MEHMSSLQKAAYYSEIGLHQQALVWWSLATSALRQRLVTAKRTAMTELFDADEGFLNLRQARERVDLRDNVLTLEAQYVEARAMIGDGRFNLQVAQDWTNDSWHFLGAFDADINRFLDENFVYIAHQDQRDVLRWEMETVEGAPRANGNNEDA